MKRGIISFVDIDASRFTQVDELQCIPYFSKISWGFFRHRTKLLCRKCGNHIGNAYDVKTLVYPPVPDGSDSSSGLECASSSGSRVTFPRFKGGNGAESFGLPYLSAYLDSLGTNFTHGANFATAASTITLPISIKPNGRSSPFYLYLQYLQFQQFKSGSQIIRKRGGIFANLMPKEEYFSKALYTFDIGQNDLGIAFFLNKSVKEVNASVPDIVKKFSANIKDIYNLGGRSFWIHNTGPIGCLPYILTYFSSPKDGAGCVKIYNEVAQHFNLKLKEAVVQLRKDFPSAAFTYVDVYSVKYSMFKELQKYGFELPLVSCCGYGRKYRYNSDAEGEETIVVNGTKIFVGSCGRPSVRVNYDGIHYTEAAARFVFDQISTGNFSDPPVPLKMACHTS
ncbi:hypothetical protein Patl1_08371 [Pistacia atlantica]|uniref:Uncharacterized protein n=1 Tax=Pistacia atlantica TaxID=434234 RepID=A0ACC1AK36_9ROSI|nr:hypothetical protein Patl1_08371 [Pistacia atlantica]